MAEVMVIIPEGQEQDKEQAKKQLVGEIVRKGMMLIADPQADIQATDLFVWKKTERQNWDQVLKPSLPKGKAINRAVRLEKPHGEIVDFLILRDGDNRVSVRRNEGGSAVPASALEGISVSEDHEEIIVDVVRKRDEKSGVLGLGKKSRYFNNRVVLGGVPGIAMDRRTSKLQQVELSGKNFGHLRGNFPFSVALSDVGPMLGSGDVETETQVEDLKEILRILQKGVIDRKAMMQAIADKAMAGILKGADGYRQVNA